MQGDRSGEDQVKECGLSRTQIKALIDEWVLNERDRQILYRRYLDGVCYEPLAEEFSLSVRQVKNIVYKQGEKIFKHMPIP